jgi:hypothetical protein
MGYDFNRTNLQGTNGNTLLRPAPRRDQLPPSGVAFLPHVLRTAPDGHLPPQRPFPVIPSSRVDETANYHE